jgi:hypothetical protein
MPTVVLVADDDGGWFVVAGIDDCVVREPLQPGNDVLDAETAIQAFADVSRHAASITAGGQPLRRVGGAAGAPWIAGCEVLGSARRGITA